MSYITPEQRVRCHAIIHAASASAGAVGGGLAQIPGSDSVPICAIQATMTSALGRVFGLELTDTMARSALLATPTTIGGRLVSQFLIGWIPVAGNIINAGTAASITEALGWALAEDFARETMAGGVLYVSDQHSLELCQPGCSHRWHSGHSSRYPDGYFCGYRCRCRYRWRCLCGSGGSSRGNRQLRQ